MENTNFEYQLLKLNQQYLRLKMFAQRKDIKDTQRIVINQIASCIDEIKKDLDKYTKLMR